MGFICACQLPTKLSDYVWAFYNNNIEENKYIIICPRMDFHWDQYLSNIIELPKELYEAYEGIFEYSKYINNIYEFMDNLGIEYSKELEYIHNCLDKYSCNSCMFPNSFDNIEFVLDEYIPMCSFGNRHIYK